MTSSTNPIPNRPSALVQNNSFSDIDRVVRFKELKIKTGLSKSAIYRSIEEGTFPPPFRIGKRAVGWRLSTINAWLEAVEQNTSLAG